MKDPSVVRGGWAGVSCWERKRGPVLERVGPWPETTQQCDTGLRGRGQGRAKSCGRLEEGRTGEESGLCTPTLTLSPEQRDSAVHTPAAAQGVLQAVLTSSKGAGMIDTGAGNVKTRKAALFAKQAMLGVRYLPLVRTLGQRPWGFAVGRVGRASAVAEGQRTWLKALGPGSLVPFLFPMKDCCVTSGWSHSLSEPQLPPL